MAVRGNFQQGDAVDLSGPEGLVFARGLVTYSSSELDSIRGRRASEILGILGYHLGDEVIHKDDLVILPEARVTARR
jgi:glutamate 5-kinase